jgi:hypothetical protein
LKSPESEEGIQENPSPFPWFFLVWLGFGLEGFGPRRALRSRSPRLGCQDALRSISVARKQLFCNRIACNFPGDSSRLYNKNFNVE